MNFLCSCDSNSFSRSLIGSQNHRVLSLSRYLQNAYTSPNLVDYSIESQPSNLLIHGALPSPNGYSFVAPYLKEYHLPVLALPCRSTASSTSSDSALVDP